MIENLFESLSFHIKGITPHVQHNGQMADPANPYAVELKRLTKLKDKTPETYRQIRDVEWEGSLYLDGQRRVVVPGTSIEGALFRAGKKSRLGQVVRNSICSDGHWPLIYSGPKSVESLREDLNFRLETMVVNPSTKSRVMRTRPSFSQWELKFEVKFRSDMISAGNVYELVRILGTDIGLSDTFNKMGGRFLILLPESPPKSKGNGRVKVKVGQDSEDDD